ncbi:MAG: RHS repeat-associated core domain-containing protein [Desulfobacter sp.]|nr:RHS repeat-associated core domain-containing protein [Desulfobacter sp.]
MRSFTLWELSQGKNSVLRGRCIKALAGQYFDAETNLHYNLNRYYDPQIGRYFRADPFGDGLNLYAYCFNNPNSLIDPLELCAANNHQREMFCFGKRPLGVLPDIFLLTRHPVHDFFNIELSHEHGFFIDGAGNYGANVGFFPDGRRWNTEDPSDYRMSGKLLEGTLMRKALNNLKFQNIDGDYLTIGNMYMRQNNCQDWASRLRKEYYRLKELGAQN